MKEQLLKYAHYNLWANQKFSNFLNTLPPEQLQAEIVSSFPSIYKTVQNFWGAQLIWLNRLHGTSPVAFPNEGFSGSFAAAAEQLLKTSQQLIDFIESSTDELLRNPLTYKTMDGKDYKNITGDI